MLPVISITESKIYKKYTLNSFLASQVQKNKCQELHSYEVNSTNPNNTAYFSIPVHYIYSND
jgi:hypothetical protein